MVFSARLRSASGKRRLQQNRFAEKGVKVIKARMLGIWEGQVGESSLAPPEHTIMGIGNDVPEHENVGTPPATSDDGTKSGTRQSPLGRCRLGRRKARRRREGKERPGHPTRRTATWLAT